LETLKIKNITKKYEGHLALDNVSLTIPLGKTIALLGHNGAGKSTLIRILLQIISKTSGQILLEGEELKEKDIRKFGYLPEERGLYKGMKVLEQLIYFARLRGLTKKVAKENATFWLDKLDLSEWKNKTVFDLSKGMQQKIQFITAIIHNPAIIILDEPFSGFDPVNAKTIIGIILELKAAGKTILFSSHQMDAVEEICDEIAILNKSKIVLQGSLEQLKQQFTTNNYLVTGKGSLKSNKYLIILETNSQSWLVQPLKETNILIDYLNNQIELMSFKKVEPSLTEIFIQSFNLT
tara:strand:- start:935 stop:1816 length:882 start_codon:yes stop_codon:yes gene_type:complete